MTQSETALRPKERPWLEFGAALKTWLSRLEIPNANLARDLAVSESTVSDWLAGRKRPSPLHLLQILDKIRSKVEKPKTYHPDVNCSRDEKVKIHREDILDALADLDYSWGDIEGMLQHIARESQSAFKSWWEGFQPVVSVSGLSVAPGSPSYTAFEETESITKALISWRGYRERQCRTMVLCGLTGMGKTETAIAIANDVRVRNVYREGVLWVKSDLVNGSDLLARLCAAVGVEPEPGADLEDAWRNWIGDPERRVLLVLDDVKTAAPIQTLLQGAGPLVSCLVTTQNGKENLDACYQLFPRDQVMWETLRGFSPDTARVFVEKRMGRLLSDEEWELMRRIGRKSGWHPQSLHFTASGDTIPWQGVVDAMERGEIPFPKVKVDIVKQIENTDCGLRSAVVSLMKWMLFPTCFGALYAGAVLGGKPPEAAKLILDDLELSGLIEGLPPAGSIGFVDRVWRITPIVQLALDNKADLRWHQKLGLMLGHGKFNRYISQHGMKTMRSPRQFRFWAILWWCANLGREFVCDLRLRSRFRAGAPLSIQDYESCLSGAESLWRRQLQNQGTDIPMEVIALQSAQAQLRGVIGVVGMAACTLILGLVGNAVLLKTPDFLNIPGGASGLWLTWFLPLMIGFVLLAAIQYQVAVPHLWLMTRIGVRYKGLAWIVQKAQAWGMPKLERAEINEEIAG